jgi:hypothetical protein
MTSPYPYYYNDVKPDPHNHNIEPNPHTHAITPNPHRHAMRFLESGSLNLANDGCRLPSNILVNMIYNSLNTELEGNKPRVTEAAKKGNWITANKIGIPIWEYLEDYYINRVVCYFRSRTWFTEFESLSIVPTSLEILPTGLELTYDRNNIVGPQGQQSMRNDTQIFTETLEEIEVLTSNHSDIIVSHADTPIVTVHNDVPHSDTPANTFVQCKPQNGPCSYYQTDSCDSLGAYQGAFEPC